MKKNNEEFIVEFFDTTPKTIRGISQEEIEKRFNKQERETTKIRNILFAVVLVLIFMLAAVLIDVWIYKADSYQCWMEVRRKENLTEGNQELQKERFNETERQLNNLQKSVNQIPTSFEKQDAGMVSD